MMDNRVCSGCHQDYMEVASNEKNKRLGKNLSLSPIRHNRGTDLDLGHHGQFNGSCPKSSCYHPPGSGA
jgi:hypothetical protein